MRNTPIGGAATEGATTISQGRLVRDQASMIDALHTAGATVTIGGQVEQPFLHVPGTQVTVNDADVLVFEYADKAAAQTDTTALSDTLNGKGTTMVNWIASPHAYHTDRIIVLYIGDDATIVQLLQGILGAPFAELKLLSR